MAQKKLFELATKQRLLNEAGDRSDLEEDAHYQMSILAGESDEEVIRKGSGGMWDALAKMEEYLWEMGQSQWKKELEEDSKNENGVK